MQINKKFLFFKPLTCLAIIIIFFFFQKMGKIYHSAPHTLKISYLHGLRFLAEKVFVEEITLDHEFLLMFSAPDATIQSLC